MSDCSDVDVTPANARGRVLPQGLPQSTRLTRAALPLSFWLANHPPGWVSQLTVTEAKPITLAREVYVRAQGFDKWLFLPATRQWDTFALQSFSAKLFGRFRNDSSLSDEVAVGNVALLDLAWPPGSTTIIERIRELQQILRGPFAVFKAVRTAVQDSPFPTVQELDVAANAVCAARVELRLKINELGVAIDRYSTLTNGATPTNALDKLQLLPHPNFSASPDENSHSCDVPL